MQLISLESRSVLVVAGNLPVVKVEGVGGSYPLYALVVTYYKTVTDRISDVRGYTPWYSNKILGTCTFMWMSF